MQLALYSPRAASSQGEGGIAVEPAMSSRCGELYDAASPRLILQSHLSLLHDLLLTTNLRPGLQQFLPPALSFTEARVFSAFEGCQTTHHLQPPGTPARTPSCTHLLHTTDCTSQTAHPRLHTPECTPHSRSSAQVFGTRSGVRIIFLTEILE